MKAYWITPEGKTIELTGQKHIESIRNNAATFGLTEVDIQEAFDQFNDCIGQEGMARELIIKRLIYSGYVRIREYRQFWSVNTGALTRKFEKLLQSWAFDRILEGCDRYAEVKIDSPNYTNILTLADIAQGKEL